MEWSEHRSNWTASRSLLLNLRSEIQSGSGTLSNLPMMGESRVKEGRGFPGVGVQRPSNLASQGQPSDFLKEVEDVEDAPCARVWKFSAAG